MIKNPSLFRRLHDYVYETLYPIKEIQRIPTGPITWPVYQRTHEKLHLQHFTSYEKDVFGRQVNSKNMLFIVGAQKSGKSWLAKNCCKNSLIIDNEHIQIGGFLGQLKINIIDYIVDNNLVNIDEIIKITTSQFEKQYIDIYFNKYLKSELSQEQLSQINAIEIDIPKLDWNSAELEFWMEDAKQLNQNNNYSFSQQLQNIASITYKDNPIKGAIQIILDMLQTIEIEKIQHPYDVKETTGGLQQIDFLFSILNYISGFSIQNQCKKEFSLILLNIDKLFEYYRYNQDTLDFIDHLLLSTYNDTGIRNHFPIAITSANGNLFNRDIYEMMNIDLHYTLHIDVEDVPFDKINFQVDGVFTLKEQDKIYRKIGGNLEDWHKLMKKAVGEDNFNLQKWLNEIDTYQVNIFQYLCNMTLCNVEVSELLDNNKADLEMQNILRLISHYNGRIYTGTYFADSEVMQRPMVNAMQQEHILYHPKHKSHLYFSKQNYLSLAHHIYGAKLNRWKDYFNPSRIIPTSSFRTIMEKRGNYHRLQSEEPRQKYEDDVKQGFRPYHDYYI